MKTVKFMNLDLTLAGVKEKIQLEKALGGSPLNHILPMMSGVMTDGEEMDLSKMQIPSLPFMITVLHASALKFNAGTSMDKMIEIVESYLDKDDNSVFGLFAVVMEVLQTGKYLPTEEPTEETTEA